MYVHTETSFRGIETHEFTHFTQHASTKLFLDASLSSTFVYSQTIENETNRIEFEKRNVIISIVLQAGEEKLKTVDVFAGRGGEWRLETINRSIVFVRWKAIIESHYSRS